MSLDGAAFGKRIFECLNENGYKYELDHDMIRLVFDLDNQLEKCDFEFRIVSHGELGWSVPVKAKCPLPVSEEKKKAVMELITRVNYGINDGYFSLQQSDEDPQESIIAYNTRFYCSDVVPTTNDIKSTVMYPAVMMNRYGNALFNVLKLDADPEEEARRVEG